MTLPTTMKIIEITAPGGPEVLKVQDAIFQHLKQMKS